jgi:hypothetical protein
MSRPIAKQKDKVVGRADSEVDVAVAIEIGGGGGPVVYLEDGHARDAGQQTRPITDEERDACVGGDGHVGMAIVIEVGNGRRPRTKGQGLEGTRGRKGAGNGWPQQQHLARDSSDHGDLGRADPLEIGDGGLGLTSQRVRRGREQCPSPLPRGTAVSCMNPATTTTST